MDRIDRSNLRTAAALIILIIAVCVAGELAGEIAFAFWPTAAQQILHPAPNATAPAAAPQPSRPRIDWSSALPAPTWVDAPPVKANWKHCARPTCSMDGECSKYLAERSNETAPLSSPRCCSDVHVEHLMAVVAIFSLVTEEPRPNVFLAHGTLLGAFRDGDVNPWETDVDLAIDSRSMLKWETWKSEFERRGFLVFYSNGNIRVCRRGTAAMYLTSRYRNDRDARPWGKGRDWFPYLDLYNVREEHAAGAKGGGASRAEANNSAVLLEVGGRGWAKFPRKAIYPLSNCTLRGRSVPCPADTKRVLRRLYGEDYDVRKHGARGDKSYHVKSSTLH